jgi:hypothetical protein
MRIFKEDISNGKFDPVLFEKFEELIESRSEFKKTSAESEMHGEAAP